ncbi:hypothetical protein JGI25_01191, partial [Candidatus Kryptobacter tengchongensis]
MKKLVILLMLSILNLAISQYKIFPFKINKVVLENGLTVLSVPFDSPGI